MLFCYFYVFCEVTEVFADSLMLSITDHRQIHEESTNSIQIIRRISDIKSAVQL